MATTNLFRANNLDSLPTDAPMGRAPAPMSAENSAPVTITENAFQKGQANGDVNNSRDPASLDATSSKSASARAASASPNAAQVAPTEAIQDPTKVEGGVPGDPDATAEALGKKQGLSKAAVSALRKALRAKYAAYLKAKMLKQTAESEALAAAQFDGKLAPPPTAGKGSKDDQGERPFDAVASLVKDGPAEPGFTMRQSETEAQVKELVAEGSRDLASDPQSGVLGVDSDTLFERVHHAHESCLRQKCVIWPLPFAKP